MVEAVSVHWKHISSFQWKVKKKKSFVERENRCVLSYRRISHISESFVLKILIIFLLLLSATAK